MSIASEISRLQTAKTDIKAAIEAKGVSVGSSVSIEDYDTYIAQISGGGWPLSFGFICGGLDYLTSFEKVNNNTFTCTNLSATLAAGRDRAGGAFYDEEYMYILGGKSGATTISSSGEALDVAAEARSSLSITISTTQWLYGALQFKDVGLLCGGRSGTSTSATTTINKYTFATDSIATYSDTLGVARSSGMATSYTNDYGYMFGGHNASGSYYTSNGDKLSNSSETQIPITCTYYLSKYLTWGASVRSDTDAYFTEASAVATTNLHKFTFSDETMSGVGSAINNSTYYASGWSTEEHGVFAGTSLSGYEQDINVFDPTSETSTLESSALNVDRKGAEGASYYAL